MKDSREGVPMVDKKPSDLEQQASKLQPLRPREPHEIRTRILDEILAVLHDRPAEPNPHDHEVTLLVAAAIACQRMGRTEQWATHEFARTFQDVEKRISSYLSAEDDGSW